MEDSIEDLQIDEKILELSTEISEKLNELEMHLRILNEEKANIKFPGGVISYASNYREYFPFIFDDTIKRNIAYHLMLKDIFNWLLTRFDVKLVAEAMLIKTAIVNFGTIIEAITKSVARTIIEEDKKELGVLAACTILIKKRIIPKKIKKDIEWVWGIRNKLHVDLLSKWEYEEYSIEDYQKARSITGDLILKLNIAYNEKKIKGGNVRWISKN